MQIRKLEAELGVLLLDRSRQPVVATDVGRAVVEQARTVLREAGRLHDIVSAGLSLLEGELRVGVIPTLGPYLLPRFLPSFVARYPAATLIVEELQTQQILARLEQDALHAGLVATSIGNGGLTERPLFREPFLAYLPGNHRLASHDQVDPAELRRDDVLLLAEGHCFREQVLEVCHGEIAAPAPGAMHFASGNLETLKALVERGCGVTLLPALAVEDWRRSYGSVLRPFSPPEPSRQVYLVQRRAYLKGRLIDAFVEELLTGLPPALRPAAGLGRGPSSALGRPL